MRKDDRRVLGFAAAVCVTCSLLLSAAATLLKERQAYNVELDRKLNVLKAFGVETVVDGKRISAETVEGYFRDHVREAAVDPAAAELVEDPAAAGDRELLPLYLWQEGGITRKYAFPISGKGLWSTIYGYLALDQGLAEIVGITFYRHGETPGLGGEIATDWFQGQFRGKRVYKDGRPQAFEVVKGTVADKYPGGNDHAVDGITGATMTGDGVEAFLNEDLARYEPYFSKVREG